MVILRRTERAMVRAMCGAKLMEKKRTEDFMEMLELKETVVQKAKANEVRWYGHVLGRDDGHVLRKALEFEVKGKRKRGRPKKTWKTQVKKESKSQGSKFKKISSCLLATHHHQIRFYVCFTCWYALDDF